MNEKKMIANDGDGIESSRSGQESCQTRVSQESCQPGHAGQESVNQESCQQTKIFVLPG